MPTHATFTASVMQTVTSGPRLELERCDISGDNKLWATCPSDVAGSLPHYQQPLPKACRAIYEYVSLCRIFL